MDHDHQFLRHDDGDLGAVVRAARALDAGSATAAASTLWLPATSRPGGDGGAPQSLDSSMFSLPFSSSACSSSPRFQCTSASLPVTHHMGTTPPPVAFRHQDLMNRLLHTTEQSRLPSGTSFPSVFEGLDTRTTSSSRFNGLLDSASTFSPSSRAMWLPGSNDVRIGRVTPPAALDSPDFTRTLLSTFLRGPLSVGKSNDSLTSADTLESFASSATIVSRASPARVNSEFSAISELQRSLATSISASSSKTVEHHSPAVMHQANLTPPNSSSSTKGRGAKRRKAQQKRVVCIPASSGARRPTGECLPNSDLWAWRKYGQKPIKGSPHPRGYYRCSSSKGCPARKQVERSRTDPTMLIVTYTSDHNHPWPTYRNALAGSTRPSSLERSNAQSPEAATIVSPTEPSGASSCEPNPDNPPGASLIDSSEPAATEPEGCHMYSPQHAAAEAEAGRAMDADSTLVVDVDEAFSPDHGHGLPVVGSNLPDSLFCEPEEHLGTVFAATFGRPVLDERSIVEEGESAAVDPYNLFNWSSNTFTRVDDAVR